MPRTKQKRGQSKAHESFLRDFNRLMQLKIRGLENDFRTMDQKFETFVEATMVRYPKEIQTMTLGELLTFDETPKKKAVQETPRSHRRLPRSAVKTKRSLSSDGGYQSQKSSASDQYKGQVKRSRSSSQNRKPKLPAVQSLRKGMRTPNVKTNNSFVITPKIKLNSAMNVLRKPKDGEMVFSTQGSPLLVSTTVSNHTANVNVPMKNGHVVSLLPFNESSLTDNIHLDEDTRKQLRILQSHLSKVLK